VLLAGRRLDADDAFRIGLVAEVVPAGELIKRAHAVLDRMARSGPLALRLTKLVADAPGGHPITDDLAQAILFESTEKQNRMDAFLAGGRP
jgi:enoyl-CoA hydratase/carnithine racemase